MHSKVCKLANRHFKTPIEKSEGDFRWSHRDYMLVVLLKNNIQGVNKLSVQLR